MKIDVHMDRVGLVLDPLMRAYRARVFPYNHPRAQVTLHDDNLPKNLRRGGLEDACYRFFACGYMRGPAKSNTMVRALSRLYDDWPELFRMYRAATVDPGWLQVLLEDEYNLGFLAAPVARNWVENAQRMMARYGGDPRNIYHGVSTYEQALERIRNDKKGGGFLDFQEKMTSMLSYFLLEAKLIAPFPFPIMVDFHAVRLAVQFEFITFPEYAPGSTIALSDELLGTLRQMFFDYMAKRNEDPVQLSNAVWLLSSMLCSAAPGDVVLDVEGCFPHKLSKLYERTCGSCPVQRWCVNYVGQDNY